MPVGRVGGCTRLAVGGRAALLVWVVGGCTGPLMIGSVRGYCTMVEGGWVPSVVWVVGVRIEPVLVRMFECGMRPLLVGGTGGCCPVAEGVESALLTRGAWGRTPWLLVCFAVG